MAARKHKEWIGEYWLFVETYHSYKKEYIFESVSLGKCLGEDEACTKAAQALMRDYADAQIRECYILNGWGNLIYL